MGEFTDMLTGSVGGDQPPDAPPPMSYRDMLLEEGVAKEVPEIQEPTDPIMRAVLDDQRAGVTGAVRNFGRMLAGVLKEEDLPSFVDFTNDGKLTPGQGLRIALAYALNVDDAPVADIIKKEFPGTKVTQDRFGNSIVDIEGERYYLNQPGVDKADVARFIAQVGQFIPAARLGNAAQGTAARAGLVGAGSAATSVGQDVASIALGSEQGIDPLKAAGAGAGGAAFEILAPIVGRIFNKISGRKFALPDGTLTDDGRKLVQDIGLDPELIGPDLAKKLNNLGERVQSKFASEAKQAVQATPSARAAESAEFGIPLTKGEATGSGRQIAREEEMRNFARGEGAARVIQNFDETRAQRIQQAGDSVQGALSGTAGRNVDDAVEAAETVAEGVKKSFGVTRGKVDEAYSVARKLNAEISGDGMKGMRTFIVRRMRENNATLLPGETPATERALRLLRNVTSIRDGKLTGTDLQRLENFRRTLGTTKNSGIRGAARNPTDERNVRLLKEAYDEWLDAAVDRSLFQGDEAAISALKEARAARFKQSQLFDGRDDAAKVIGRIIEDNASSNEVANWLFGNATVGASGRSVRLVSRIEKIFGRDSREFNLIREGAFMRMLYGNKGTPEGIPGQTLGREALANNLRKALGPQSREFLGRLFTQDEIKQFARLERALRNTVPPKGATNPSGSGFTAIRALQDMIQKFVVIGSVAGGGPLAGAGTALTQQVFRNLTQKGAAKKAVTQIPLPAYRAPRFTALGGAGGAASTDLPSP